MKTPYHLSDREIEILRWRAANYHLYEIAVILKISEATVKKHCERIFLELELNNLGAALTRAYQENLIDVHSVVIRSWPFKRIENKFHKRKK